MKLTKPLIFELGQILREDYKTILDGKDLEKFAYSLVGYFDLLLKVENRHRFGNSPNRAIDTNRNSVLD